MIIRPATLSDIPEITAIYAENVLNGTGSYEYSPPDEAEMASRFSNITQGGYPYFVAVIENEIVGYAYASSYNKREGFKYMVEDSIYIKRKGEGLGKALLLRLIDECTSKGMRQMLAVIGDLNNTASIRLHRACGFILVGTLPASGWKHGRWVDTVFMQRPLGDGETTKPKAS